jgi:inosose dehydratase
MYRPLGRGDVDITSIVGSVEHGGYQGWYVLEQDTILARPVHPGLAQLRDQAPMADVRASIEHLFTIVQALP